MEKAQPNQQERAVVLMLLGRLLSEEPKPEWADALGVPLGNDAGREFQALLSIPHGRFVPPYLSAHQKAMAPQEYMSGLVGFYKASGLALHELAGERPDHVGVVLEYLGLCAQKEGMVEQRAWDWIRGPLHTFAETLANHTEHPIYKRVAEELLMLTGTDPRVGTE